MNKKMRVEVLDQERTSIVRPIAKALCPPVPGELTARHGVHDQISIWGTCTAVYAGVCSTVDWVLA